MCIRFNVNAFHFKWIKSKVLFRLFASNEFNGTARRMEQSRQHAGKKQPTEQHWLRCLCAYIPILRIYLVWFHMHMVLFLIKTKTTAPMHGHVANGQSIHPHALAFHCDTHAAKWWWHGQSSFGIYLHLKQQRQHKKPTNLCVWSTNEKADTK